MAYRNMACVEPVLENPVSQGFADTSGAISEPEIVTSGRRFATSACGGAYRTTAGVARCLPGNSDVVESAYSCL